MMVKICGITNREDALAAVDAGASALGFNFYPASPRYIHPDTAAEIANGLPVLRVGVCVDHVPANDGMDILQLHGSESPEDVPDGRRVWKAFRVSGEWESSALSRFPTVEAFLLDGPTPGAGEAFDWKRATGVGPIILAGGLGPDNIAAAIREVRPWGVDACSKLERAPGLKDHDKMRRFVRAALELI